MRLLSLVVVVVALGSCKSNTINSTTNNNDFITETVDANGKTLRHSSGLAVVVPSGALTAPAQLTVGTQGDGYPALPAGMAAEGPIFAVKPHGQTFDQKIQIYMPVPSGGASGVQVYSASSDTGSWAPVTSPDGTVNPADSFDGAPKISVAIQHFSYYALLASTPSPVAGTWTGTLTLNTNDPCAPMQSGMFTLQFTATGANMYSGMATLMGAPMPGNLSATASGNTLDIFIAMSGTNCNDADGAISGFGGTCTVAGNMLTCPTLMGTTCGGCADAGSQRIWSVNPQTSNASLMKM